jgi:D-alanine-D-alanine ligase
LLIFAFMNLRERGRELYVWVLAPYLVTEDANLRYYYDFTHGMGEYKKVFTELGCEWKWVNLTMDRVEETIREIAGHPTPLQKIVINLCDGDETNGVPGVSVIHALERHNLVYTGSNDPFYRITTSKIPMKEAFDRAHVPTAPWKVMESSRTPINGVFRHVGSTLIVKPAISAGSLGLSIKNVVNNEEELTAILREVENGYHGWNFSEGGVFVEEFIKGREFTTLVVGSSSHPDKLIFYPPAERVFHASLPEKERFLSFDRLWETYDKEAPMPDDGYMYEYAEPEPELVPELREISLAAYQAVGGTGYGRLDIRMDTATRKMYVLEVNAQCGLSEDDNYTSIGAILRFARKSFTDLTVEILEDALLRHQPTTS